MRSLLQDTCWACSAPPCWATRVPNTSRRKLRDTQVQVRKTHQLKAQAAMDAMQGFAPKPFSLPCWSSACSRCSVLLCMFCTQH